ncbi:VG15 protein [Glutamicibacter arilaitensis]|uniref:VG15 protein n=1 Tax=Glutamicibacter arilaitensis TaxID=256701 RepID=UPI003FD2B715
MASSEEARQLRAANAELVGLVTDELESIFYALNLERPEQARDAMIEVLPLLLDKYGPIAGQISADWYRMMLPGSKPEVIGSKIKPEQIQRKVHWAAADLFTDNPFATLRKLTSTMGVWARQPGRETIQINADRDKVGWGRIPSGPKTCAFCLMLASRSGAWLYNSEESALRAGHGDKYHHECNCEPMLIRGADDLPDTGFDHRGAYVAYSQAIESVGGAASPDEITAALRRMFPDLLTDGVHEIY